MSIDLISKRLFLIPFLAVFVGWQLPNLNKMSVNHVKSFFKNHRISIQALFPKRVLNSKETESSTSIDSKPTNKPTIEINHADDQTHIFDLPLELIFDILLQLPREEISSCSLTCKLLLSLTTSPSFLVSYHSLHRHTTHNFFFIQKFCEPPELISTSSCVPSSIFNHLEKSKHFNAGLSVLASSSGLLLIGNPNRINRIQLIVFNPATKESLSIPLLPDRFSHKWGIAFVVHMNPRSFEIIIVGSGRVVYTFSSKNKHWTSITASADDNHIDNELYSSNNITCFSCKSAVHANGILCWEYGKSHLRVYNIEEAHFFTVKFPLCETTSSYCFSEAMDHLKYISITDCMLSVWVLEKACLSWKLECEMTVNSHLSPIGFVESDYVVVLLGGSWRRSVFTYSLFERKLKRCVQDPILLREWNMGQFFPYRLNIDFPSIPT